MTILARTGAVTALQTAQAGAANGANLDTTEAQSAVVELSGTYTGITANFEASNDGGTSWFTVALRQLSATTPTYVAAATATGLYRLEDARGINAVRARTTVATPTGSMTVRGIATL